MITLKKLGIRNATDGEEADFASAMRRNLRPEFRDSEDAALTVAFSLYPLLSNGDGKGNRHFIRSNF